MKISRFPFWISGIFYLLGYFLKLVINGQERDTLSSHNLDDLLKELEISGTHIAIALNSQVIPRSNYGSTLLREGDKVEIVHAVGGG